MTQPSFFAIHSREQPHQRMLRVLRPPAQVTTVLRLRLTFSVRQVLRYQETHETQIRGATFLKREGVPPLGDSDDACEDDPEPTNSVQVTQRLDRVGKQ